MALQRVAHVSTKCNYFQVLENAVDPVHTAILHTDTDLGEAYGNPVIRMRADRAGSANHCVASVISVSAQDRDSRSRAWAVTLPFMRPIVQMGVWTTPDDDLARRFSSAGSCRSVPRKRTGLKNWCAGWSTICSR